MSGPWNGVCAVARSAHGCTCSCSHGTIEAMMAHAVGSAKKSTIAAAEFMISMAKPKPCSSASSWSRIELPRPAPVISQPPAPSRSTPASTVADGPEGERDDDRAGGGDQAGGQLGDHDPGAARLEGERHQAGALAPLAGDQQDRQHRQQHAGGDVHQPEEVAEEQVLRLGPDEHRRGDERRDDHDGQRQPEAGPGVDQLAQLDLDQSAHRDGRPAHVDGRRVLWWCSCGGSRRGQLVALGVGGELRGTCLRGRPRRRAARPGRRRPRPPRARPAPGWRRCAGPRRRPGWRPGRPG